MVQGPGPPGNDHRLRKAILEEHSMIVIAVWPSKRPPKCSNCFSCTTPLELYNYDVRNVTWREDDCGPPDYYRMYAVPGLISFMIATLLVNIAYRKRWYILYALLYLKLSIKGYRRQRNGGNFLFDGFLSYHASDADWVRDVLLQKLESPPMQFRLCVAERDFIPGMEITENICRAITQSRTSLFVISREFYRSRWCMFEVSLAQHRLFESDRQDGMVFIKKDDVDESELSTLLQYLIKSRTYIQIPPDGSNETLNNLFWLQVQAALEK
ncbi:toll-like receptor 2 type-2 [Rhipicephalus sanguineus]|nr:toll-like receptor 2 type-2 [Rhipicephalus sanguineus]